MVPHRAHLFTFYLKVGKPHFPAVKIFWFKLFCCVTHRVHFFLPHRVQLLFWMVPHRAHLFTSNLKVGIPHFPAVKLFDFNYFLVLPIVCTFFCTIVCSYYLEWCRIERTCLPLDVKYGVGYPKQKVLPEVPPSKKKAQWVDRQSTS